MEVENETAPTGVDAEAPESAGAEPEVVEAEPELVEVDEEVGKLVAAGLDPDHSINWLKGVEAALPEGQTKFKLGDPSKWPVEAQQLLWNTMQEHKRNADGLDKQLAERDGAGVDFAAEKRKLAADRANLTNLWTSEKIKAFVESVAPKGEPPDAYDNPIEAAKFEGKRAGYEVVKALVDLLRTEGEAQREALLAAEKAAIEDEKISETAKYINQFPEDFDDKHQKYNGVYDRVEALMKASNYTMPVKDAHELVLGQLALQADHAQAEVARQRARNRIARGSGKGQGPPATPKFSSSAEEIAFYSAFPEAQKRDYELAIKHGTSY